MKHGFYLATQKDQRPGIVELSPNHGWRNVLDNRMHNPMECDYKLQNLADLLADQWQDIKDAPKDGTIFTVYAGEILSYCSWVNGKWEEFEGGMWFPLEEEPTHFRILKPPTELP